MAQGYIGQGIIVGFFDEGREGLVGAGFGEFADSTGDCIHGSHRKSPFWLWNVENINQRSHWWASPPSVDYMIA